MFIGPGQPGRDGTDELSAEFIQTGSISGCESAGVTGSQLFVSNDQRFLHSVAQSNVVRRMFKKAAKKVLGIHPLDVHIKSITTVVNLNG